MSGKLQKKRKKKIENGKLHNFSSFYMQYVLPLKNKNEIIKGIMFKKNIIILKMRFLEIANEGEEMDRNFIFQC